MGDQPEIPKFPSDGLANPPSDKAPTQLKEYQYDGLPPGQFIRMLILYPGKRDDPLTGKLELFEIDSSESYEPLSYVWGPPPNNADYQIFIKDDKGDGNLQLTASLSGALKRLRYADRERRLWADQICINQKNMVERGQQVQFMNKIYKNASHVLVWLGQDAKGPNEKSVAESAFNLIRELDKIFEDESESEKFHTAHTGKNLEKQSRDPWLPLDHLTELPWFTRAWIVQEIGTQAPATLFWGEAEIDWMVLYRVCERLTDFHHLRNRFNIRTSDIKYVFQRFIEPPAESYHANRFSFMYELHRARSLKVTDPRDRVFAMLGHYSVSGSNPQGTRNVALANMKADYTITTAQAYFDVAEKALTGDTSLIVLAAVQHMSLPASGDAPKSTDSRVVDKDTLPSWVPDWRTYQSFILSEPINPHRAHGKTSSDLSVDTERLILSIHGVKIDVVEACSKPLAAKEFHLHSTSSVGQQLAIESLWREICLKDRFNLDDTYVNGESAFFAYMQTLANGCVQIATREARPYDESFKSECLAKEAKYLMNTLGPDAVEPSLRELAETTGAKDEWSRAANGASKNRIFARTKKGYFVLGPKVMKEGDIVCVLFGGKMPFVLRPWGPYFLLVGECYVHGLMNGEAIDMLEQKALVEDVFDLV